MNREVHLDDQAGVFFKFRVVLQSGVTPQRFQNIPQGFVKNLYHPLTGAHVPRFHPRRRAILAHVDALVRRHGEARVYAFD